MSPQRPLGSRRSTHKGIALAAAFVTAGALSAAALPSASAGHTTNGASKVVRSKAKSVGTTNVSRLKAPTAAQRGAHHPLPVLRPGSGTAHARYAPSAKSASGAAPGKTATSSSRLLSNFDGVDAIQNRNAAGFNLEPPDEGLGASNDYVANFVNVTGAIYRPDGTMVQGPFYLNTFFQEPDAANTSDPRVYYDPSTQRWFATILVYSFNADFSAITESHIDVATSRTANPAGRWDVYKFDASDAVNTNHAGCPCLADYPILGVDKYNIYISTNEFTGDFSGFNGTQLYVLSKSQLVAHQSTVNMVQFENLSVAGTQAYHVQPANTYGKSAAEWMMSSLDPNSTYDNRIAVWALTHRKSVTSGNGRPNLSVHVISSESYSFPPIAQTPPGNCSSCNNGAGAPTSGLVNTDFDAMQEVQYINGQLVGALNTGVTIPGDVSERSGVAWFVVHPSLTTNGQVGRHTHVTRQGYVAKQGLYLLYPHINMTDNGAMAMTFSFGGPETYLSAAYSVAKPGGGFGGIHRAAAGVTSDNGFTGTDQYGPVGRWGDYSNGEIIPGTNRVWLATQYIPNTGTGYSNWGNRIFELKLLG